MFIPYRAKIKITRIPTVTIIVAVVCLLVFWAQQRSWERIEKTAKAHCTAETAETPAPPPRAEFQRRFSCPNILLHIYFSSDTEKHLAWHVKHFEDKGDPEAAATLTRLYRDFASKAPPDITRSLVHRSGSWNPLQLLSATISHASWDHVLGNLFFFIAFAMVVETVIGPVLFLLMFLAMGLGTGALENLLTTTREGGSSLGLSGVVMSMMTLAAYLAPKVKIKFFYFYFLFFGVLSWPLWSVAIWYVFWDLLSNHFWREWSNTNYAAHLTGAAMGLFLGLTLFREKRHWVTQHLVVDETTLKDDHDSWLYKFNILAATPVVTFFVFVYGFLALSIGIYLFVTFITTFAAQLLIAAPVVAGAMQIYRMSRPATPPWELYQKGLAALDAHRFQEALKILKPLAEGGYTKAQYTLAQLYTTLPGGYRNDPEAIRWLTAAARRGYAQAQLELGTRHMHGNQLPKDLNRAIEWLEKSAAQGIGQAAQSLGHLYENMLGQNIDKEKAIEWYYRAAVAFQKAGDKEDARAVIRHLQSLTGKHPTVLGLVAKLEKLVAGQG